MYHKKDKTHKLLNPSENHPNYRSAIVEAAQSLIGSVAVKYIHGQPELGQSRQQGFDCSGFVTYVLSSVGLRPPDYLNITGNRTPVRHANEYWDHYGIGVHHGLHLPGDLIVFTRNGYFPSHIGIVSGSENYIHSPGLDGTNVEEKTIDVEPKEFETGTSAPRVVFGCNVAGYKSPVIPIECDNYRYAQQCV